MDEGVDPTQMCQSLVQRIAQSKQLQAVTDPAILDLFENWLDELEEEVLEFLRRHPGSTAEDLSTNMGLSHSGAIFLIAKLKRETKL
jgi:hypothetical protein